jgi:hypothetical protein
MSSHHPLVSAILSDEPASRIGVLEAFASGATLAELETAADALHRFAFEEGRNIYQRVRALFQIHALHRYIAPLRPELPPGGHLPKDGHDLLLERRYTEAIASFRSAAQSGGLNDGLSSGLAAAYHGIGFQILAVQVQRSVQSLRGNRWMFRTGHALDHPLRLRPELLERPSEDAPFPVLVESTAVRMDLSHSCWSDIFFLGMDYPEGARVLNISVDLAVHRRDDAPRPPIRCSLRVIDEPVLRLTSVDLGATADITELGEVFDFARDYLGLLKAALIAAGVVPPGLEGSGQRLEDVLSVLCGKGRGLEVSSQVNDIPKGSRLAVSTNLLAGLIGLCMRATGQVSSLEGPLLEEDRRIIAGRAILGEWLGGSGGGWQDSGGIWPGIKLIEGMPVEPGDVEHCLSRGRLLPRHTILDTNVVGPEALRRLQESLVVVHGGMSQNVGPIL